MKERKETRLRDRLQLLAIKAKYWNPPTVAIGEAVTGIDAIVVAELATTNPTVASCILNGLCLLILNGATLFGEGAVSSFNKRVKNN